MTRKPTWLDENRFFYEDMPACPRARRRADDDGMTPAQLAAALSGNLTNALDSGEPGRTETSAEARGARVATQKGQIPRQVDTDALAEMGFSLSGGDDPLFYDAIFPVGWHMEHDPHDSRGIVLYDPLGRKRGFGFIKTAWYDPYASLSLCRRFTTRKIDAPEHADTLRAHHFAVYDALVERDLYVTAGSATMREWEREEELRNEALAWLDAHYPRHNSPAAYWDDPVA